MNRLLASSTLLPMSCLLVEASLITSSGLLHFEMNIQVGKERANGRRVKQKIVRHTPRAQKDTKRESLKGSLKTMREKMRKKERERLIDMDGKRQKLNT